MLDITIPAKELFDQSTNTFSMSKSYHLQLEHSLISLSKWESKWLKPFLQTKVEKTIPETIDYIRCMTLTQNVDPEAYTLITSEIIEQVSAYIKEPMTATTFSKNNNTVNREIITAEIIYYWMITFNVPFECQKWHLNKLLTLINVCNIKNQPAKKMGKKEIYSRNSALNAMRRNNLNTTG